MKARALIWNTVFAGCAIGLGVFLSARPWRVYREEQKATSQQISRMRIAEEHHTADLSKEARVDSSVGKEELARGQGFRKKGEVPLHQTP